MNVAIVKLSALGDVVHALPVASAIRAARPDARITWVVEARQAPVLREHPAIADVAIVDTRRWRRARTPRRISAALRGVSAMRRGLRARRFDVAIDAQGNLKSGVLTAMTGAPLRIGFAAARCRERANALFTNRRVMPPAAAQHVVDQYLALLTPLGLTPPARGEFHLPWNGAAEAAVDEAFGAAGLKSRDRLVVLNPGAARPDKRWVPERFRALAERIGRDGLGRVLVVWGPDELAVARAIGAGGAAVLAPPTDLDGLIAVLRRASVLVAGDTGPLHLAAALGVPCVGLFGPTSAVRNGPYGAGHRTLQAPDGRLASIDVAAVSHAVAEILA
ncbi:MAG: lipopolysaccharide heptosyltransferase I [Candidatus Rokubacteria bacterium]|nr:lipopolysaccharide heptosyltransferase I [Candidatus Rokubacteria bacterium]